MTHVLTQIILHNSYYLRNSYSHIIYITHIVKLIFKAYKKTGKIFLKFYFIYKNVSRIL